MGVLAICAATGVLLGLTVNFLADALTPPVPEPAPRHFFRRPRFLAVEILFLVLIPFLYYWEIQCGAGAGHAFGAVEPLASLHARLGAHVFLAVAMAVASVVDFEHYLIPDGITIPATVLGAVLMAVFPAAALPDYETLDTGSFAITGHPLSAFYGWSGRFGLWVSIGCVLFWAFAMLDRRWYARLGFRRAGILFLRRIRQSRLTWILLGITLLAIAGILTLYSVSETPATDAAKRALLSSLVGMVGGMGIIWCVRIIGRLALGREGMGFGDVVLMGVLGVFFGWQGAVILFFLAPFAGLVFGIARLFFRTNREIPYGPFLCLAALAVILFWESLLGYTHDFLYGPAVGAILAVMAVLMAVLLLAIQGIKRIFGRA